MVIDTILEIAKWPYAAVKPFGGEIPAVIATIAFYVLLVLGLYARLSNKKR